MPTSRPTCHSGDPPPAFPRAATILPRLSGILLGLLSGCGVLPQAGVPAGPSDGDGQELHAYLVGQVQTADGQPAAGAWLVLDPGGYEAQADATGAYAFAPLPAGARVVIAALDGAHLRSDPIVLALGDTLRLDLRLPPPPPAGARVEVWVADPAGDPLADISVRDGAGEAAWTDADGRATLWLPGGQSSRLSIEDPLGIYVSAELDLGRLDAAGGDQWHSTLSARPGASARTLGSAACAACHPDQASTWSRTAHAHALDAPVSSALEARFAAGAEVALGAAQATLEQEGEALYLRLTDSDGDQGRWLVAGFIGWPERATVPWTEEGGRAWPLPVGWVAADPSRPDYLADGGLLLPYQVERWLDAEGRLIARQPDQSAGPLPALPCHRLLPGRPGRWGRRDDRRAGGGALDGGRRGLRALPRRRQRPPSGGCLGAGSEIVHPGLLDADRASAVCGQCHANTAAHGSGLPFPVSDETGYRPGDRLDAHASPAGSLGPAEPRRPICRWRSTPNRPTVQRACVAKIVTPPMAPRPTRQGRGCCGCHPATTGSAWVAMAPWTSTTMLLPVRPCAL